MDYHGQNQKCTAVNLLFSRENSKFYQSSNIHVIFALDISSNVLCDTQSCQIALTSIFIFLYGTKANSGLCSVELYFVLCSCHCIKKCINSVQKKITENTFTRFYSTKPKGTCSKSTVQLIFKNTGCVTVRCHKSKEHQFDWHFFMNRVDRYCKYREFFEKKYPKNYLFHFLLFNVVFVSQ